MMEKWVGAIGRFVGWAVNNWYVMGFIGWAVIAWNYPLQEILPRYAG
ncbi:MAG: hypothetical protein R3E94_00920 [Burkholderiaceae bacterium]